jgi:hypothetical protein
MDTIQFLKDKISVLQDENKQLKKYEVAFDWLCVSEYSAAGFNDIFMDLWGGLYDPGLTENIMTDGECVTISEIIKDWLIV